MSLTIVALVIAVISAALAIAAFSFVGGRSTSANIALGATGAFLIGLAAAGVIVGVASYNKNAGETERQKIEECVNILDGNVIEINSYKACISKDGKMIGRI